MNNTDSLNAKVNGTKSQSYISPAAFHWSGAHSGIRSTSTIKSRYRSGMRLNCQSQLWHTQHLHMQPLGFVQSNMFAQFVGLTASMSSSALIYLYTAGEKREPGRMFCIGAGTSIRWRKPRATQQHRQRVKSPPNWGASNQHDRDATRHRIALDVTTEAWLW